MHITATAELLTHCNCNSLDRDQVHSTSVLASSDHANSQLWKWNWEKVWQEPTRAQTMVHINPASQSQRYAIKANVMLSDIGYTRQCRQELCVPDLGLAVGGCGGSAGKRLMQHRTDGDGAAQLGPGQVTAHATLLHAPACAQPAAQTACSRCSHPTPHCRAGSMQGQRSPCPSTSGNRSCTPRCGRERYRGAGHTWPLPLVPPQTQRPSHPCVCVCVTACDSCASSPVTTPRSDLL